MIIDLSHFIETGMPVYPGTRAPEIYEACSINKHGFKESCMNILTHTGTHIDVPAHIFADGKSVETYECDKFYGKAVIINCTKLSRIDEDLIVKTYDPDKKTDFLLFYTGWSVYWGDEKYYENFPLLTPDAIKYICQLSLKGIGIDAISFDATGSDKLSNHKKLLEKEIILLENLCNLDQLIGKNFILSCLPMKIKGSDGSPVRACAIIDNL
jgi:arylformamidase